LHLLRQKLLNQNPQILLIDTNHWDPLVIFNLIPTRVEEGRGSTSLTDSRPRAAAAEGGERAGSGAARAGGGGLAVPAFRKV
jgi:hypothetical protein